MFGSVAKKPRALGGVIAHKDDPIPDEDVYFSNNLDDYPITDLTLIDYKRYYDVMGNGGVFTTMVTSGAVRTDVPFATRHGTATA